MRDAFFHSQPSLWRRIGCMRTGDAKPDLFLDVNYSPGLGRLTTQTASITLRDRQGNEKLRFTAPTTVSTQKPQPAPAPAPVVTTDPVSGGRFSAAMGMIHFSLMIPARIGWSHPRSRILETQTNRCSAFGRAATLTQALTR